MKYCSCQHKHYRKPTKWEAVEARRYEVVFHRYIGPFHIEEKIVPVNQKWVKQ